MDKKNKTNGYYKNLKELWDVKDEIYKETKHLNAREHYEYICKISDRFIKKNKNLLVKT